MEKKLDKLEEKLDKLIDNQHEMNKLLERLTITVETHERRSTMLESELKRIEKEIEPIAEHVVKVNFLVSLIKWVGLSSFVSGIALLINHFKG